MRKAYLYTLLTVAAWAIGPVGSKALLLARGPGPPLRPLQVAFWAIAAGWVCLLALLAARGRLARLRDFPGRGWAVLVAMGFFGWAGYAGSLNFALARLPLPEAVIVNYLHPVFTVIFQGAGFGVVIRLLSGWEKAPDRSASPRWWRVALGLVLCLAGVAVVATGGSLATLGRSLSPALRQAPALAGVLAALFAAFSWGVYSNLGRFVRVKEGREASGLADVQTFAAMTFGLVMLGGALSAGGQLVAPVGYRASLFFLNSGPAEVNAWLVIAAMGFVLYCSGFRLWLHALELGGLAGAPHKLPPLTYLTPVLSVALGWVVLRQPFTAGFWWGAALIATGNAVNLWRR